MENSMCLLKSLSFFIFCASIPALASSQNRIQLISLIFANYILTTMPRSYIRKKQPHYSTADLDNALKSIRRNTLTVKEAWKKYHIPPSTLYARLSNRRGDGKSGAKTILSNEEEKLLIHIIQKFQEWQQPLTRSDLISIARNFMMELNKTNVTPNSSLRDWFLCFRQRWMNEIKLVEAYKLEKIRSVSCTQLVVDRWFDHLHKVLTKLRIFNSPEAIYNVDESAFGDDPGRKQVIIKRDSKYATRTQGGSGKSYTTLIMCTSASGKFLPPYIIYRAQRLFDLWMPKNSYPGTRFNSTTSGWSEELVFYDWLQFHFVPNVKSIKRPILLTMDGHRSHLSIRIIKSAMDNGIHIECLPPHSTTILQPLDVLTLSKLKRSWRKLLSDQYRKTNSEALTKQTFALLISDLFKNHLLAGHCSGGFSKAGIYPFDRRAISKEKLLQPVSTQDFDETAARVSTTDDVPNIPPTVSTGRSLRRLSCPNISRNFYSLSEDTLSPVESNLVINTSTNNCIDTSLSAAVSTSLDIGNAIDSSDTSSSKANDLIPICYADLAVDSDPSPPPTTISTCTSNTDVSLILSDAMKILYSRNEEEKFPGNIISSTQQKVIIEKHLESIYSSIPSFDVDALNTNPLSDKIVAGDFSLCQLGTQDFQSFTVHSSATFDTNSAISKNSTIDALTKAIDKYMAPVVTATGRKKKQVGRPYGEICYADLAVDSDPSPPPTTISTCTSNTDVSSILSDAMKILYSRNEEEKFPGNIISSSQQKRIIEKHLESIYSSIPSFDADALNTNSLSDKIVAGYFSLCQLDNQDCQSFTVHSSETFDTNSAISKNSTIDALTKAIDKYMAPVVTATGRKKKQVERPYGESITSVDAYLKIKKTENARKRRVTKEKEPKAKTNLKQAKSARKKTETNVLSKPGELATNTTDFNNNSYPSFMNASSSHHQQTYHFPSPISYVNNMSSFNNFSNSYYQQTTENQPNPYNLSYPICYKCDRQVYFSSGQGFRCYSLITIINANTAALLLPSICVLNHTGISTQQSLVFESLPQQLAYEYFLMNVMCSISLFYSN
ncbi:unnamed protein product [Adineta ricciae]|uniref:DDE-1 domain-containing protein n=1 Tax=Adineta ricciae TaxID=249248 RepID=A0A815TDR8_ADIRI|nr:unnamed protein product [Adineta ricciae]